ncbi:OLC1v1004807C1 [Oldenlandia corymbosa var. corymbosa]|uniref:OLC1v1004807C1 n=1 Tax=Oldenlandia corymbosa var. corymbosa TaxID=529605 RepID=A0AAV1DD43_OLDCO|nr:OLC1v1004807C1 [Oldenlandia corymbosa var. corymbosa]
MNIWQRGNGQSYGEFDPHNYWGEVEDLLAVIQYFTTIGRKVTAIIGHSKGANVVLLYASKYHDVRMVINVSARFNLKEGMEERWGKNFMEALERDGYIDVPRKKKDKVEVDYRVTLQSVQDGLAINMEKSCSKIERNYKVLIVHGSEDKIVPLQDALRFEETVRNHVTHIIEGASHCYNHHKDECSPLFSLF